MLLIHIVEAIESLKKSRKKTNFEKLTSPTNEFLSHKCRNNKKIEICKNIFYNFEKNYNSS